MKSIFIALIAAAAITAAAAPAEKTKCKECAARVKLAKISRCKVFAILDNSGTFSKEEKKLFAAKTEKVFAARLLKIAADHAAGKHGK
jgi:hypothetical protein